MAHGLLAYPAPGRLSGRGPRARLSPLLRGGVLAGLAIAAACSAHDDGAGHSDGAGTGREARRTPATERDTAHATTAAESTAAALDQWNVPEISKRLDEAGLVVSDQGKAVHHPGLRIPGEVLDVSGSELQVFVYPNQAARERDSADLDTTNAGKAGIGQPLRPRFIITNNLVALHYTLSDRMAERVSDALMARHLGRR